MRFTAVGKALKLARIEANLRQEVLATQMGISANMLSKIECGRAGVSLSDLRKTPPYIRRRVREAMIAEIRSELRDE
jgi:transcriptional regulator with XRE-family HTH domain